jgi:glycosyltransferase involved in cell wall biosynthesis
VGAKRTALLNMAQGQYIVWIDDDDSVSDDYVSELTAAIDANPGVDTITFDITFAVDGTDKNVISRHTKFPTSHLFAWRTSLAKIHLFPDINVGEDARWCLAIYSQVKTKARINKAIYHYKYNTKASVQTDTA